METNNTPLDEIRKMDKDIITPEIAAKVLCLSLIHILLMISFTASL